MIVNSETPVQRPIIGNKLQTGYLTARFSKLYLFGAKDRLRSVKHATKSSGLQAAFGATVWQQLLRY